MVCLNHPDVNAAAKCAACGKPLCAECVMIFDNQKYCSEACSLKGQASSLRAEQVIDSKRRADRRSGIGKFLTFIIIIAIAAAAVCFCLKNKETVSKHAAAGIETLKAKTGKAVEEGKKSVPQNSRYKQDRENMVNQQ